MGLAGWFPWLGEEIEKLEVLKAITTDEKQLKIIDEMIESVKAKLEENKD